MKHKVIKLEAAYTDRELSQFKAVQLDASHVDTWVSGELTTLLKPDGSTLLTHVPNIIPQPIHDAAYADFRAAAHNRPTRARASGLTATHQVKRDGTLSATTRVDPHHPRLQVARDGVMGALESTRNKAEFCRKPSDVNDQRAALDYLQFCSGVYAEFAMAHFAAQQGAVSQINPEWSIPGTVFSTVTANWCYNTFPHVDGKDFKAGLGVLTCYYVGEHPPVWLAFPKYRAAVLVKDHDVLLADVGNELHGNTATPAHDGYGSTSGRLSCIFYYRPGIGGCGTAEQEAVRREQDRQRRK